MTNKVVAAITRHRMFEQGGRVLVALSGGADSVALLHVLLSQREQWGLTLGALHLNHQLRGSESIRDRDFVAELCKRWGVPLTTEQAGVKETAEQSGESIELCARRLRYDFFEREAGRQEARVATAHTASDNAETILINLIRGTALRGLGGIPPVRGVFVRPLINCTREEIEAYCREHSLQWVEDSTNKSDDHTRNRLRRHVLPLLKNENPRIVEGLSRLSDTLREDADCLDGLAAQLQERLTRPDGCFDRAGFLQAHPALGGRVLVGLLREAGVYPEGELVDWLSAAIATGQGSRQLSGQVMFSCTQDTFRLVAVETPQPPAQFSHNVSLSELEIAPVEIGPFPGKRVVFSLQNCGCEKKMSKIQKKDLNYYLDYGKIGGVVNLRSRLPGDKLRPPGRGKTKTLKNLFQEAGVSGAQRAGAVVLADESGVLWVEGLGPHERAAVTGQTDRMIKITVEDRG